MRFLYRSILFIFLLFTAIPVQAGSIEIGYNPFYMYQQEGGQATLGGMMNGVRVRAGMTEPLLIEGTLHYSSKNHRFDIKEPVGGEVVQVRTDDSFYGGEGRIGFGPWSGSYVYGGYGYSKLKNELQMLRYTAFNTTFQANRKADRALSFQYIPLGYRQSFKWRLPGTWTVEYSRIIEGERAEELSKFPAVLDNTQADGVKGHGLKAQVRLRNAFSDWKQAGATFTFFAHYRRFDSFAAQRVGFDSNLDGVQDGRFQRTYPETDLLSIGGAIAFYF